ncbi:ferritin-like domain-containing protein [Magnetofaba australis]|uniref:Ferritin-like domain-containing protein n=1 Tax=Magnetofaba australis IT-1 TaxID=1434232 RepID=A0A1Y2K9G1_9PROT|nr:ferritin-like domain-containing protein [Magnetofaba australis]OSM05316.1 hypothetical protein MAIT1_03489 [Magnetofaba australis IT-1]
MAEATAKALFDAAEAARAAVDADAKMALTEQAAALWRAASELEDGPLRAEALADPGAPAKPELVDPRRVAKRNPGSGSGRAAHLHALTHIEFVATNLAWDAVVRFRGMPLAYYQQWAQVALEEAEHFTALRARLRDAGADYGDFAAHNGLWDMAARTADDPLARMMMVPRYLEARALEAAPIMQAKFRQAGDEASAALIARIAKEEIGHVAAGSRWFGHLCQSRGQDRREAFVTLLDGFARGRPKGPFELDIRRQAGFTEWELAWLEQGG